MQEESESPAAPSALPAAMVGALLHGILWMGVIFLCFSYIGVVERTYRDMNMMLPAITTEVLSVNRLASSYGVLSFAALLLLMPLDFLMLWALDRPGSLRVLREFWSALAMGLPAVALGFVAIGLGLPWIKVAEGLSHSAQSHDLAAQAEMVALNGRWRLVGMERDGKTSVQLPADQLSLEGGRFRWTHEGREAGGFLQLFLLWSPKQVTFTYLGGPNAGQARTGIYKIEDDKLTICLAPPETFGQDLPSKFSTAGTNHELTTWQRER